MTTYSPTLRFAALALSSASILFAGCSKLPEPADPSKTALVPVPTATYAAATPGSPIIAETLQRWSHYDSTVSAINSAEVDSLEACHNIAQERTYVQSQSVGGLKSTTTSCISKADGKARARYHCEAASQAITCRAM